MKTLLLTLLAAACLLVGCGGASQTASQTDPFVGTWHLQAAPDVVLVVVKVESAHYVNIFQDNAFSGWIRFEQRGDRLRTVVENDKTTETWQLVPLGVSEGSALLFKLSGHGDLVLNRSSSPMDVPGPSPEDL